MLGGRFVPLLAALAIAGSLAGKRVTPAGPGDAADRHADVRGRPGLGRRGRRPADLRSRPPPRTRGPGPDRPALLTCANSRPPRSPSWSSRSMLGLAYPLAMTGVSQVLFPGRADGSMVEGPRQGRRLEGHRPGLLPRHRPEGRRRQSDPGARPALLPEPAVGDGLQPVGDVLQQPGPEPEGPGHAAQGLRRRLPQARAALHAGPDRRRHPVRRGDHVGVGRRPADLRGQRAHPGQPGRARCASLPPRPRPAADRRPRQPAAASASAGRGRSTSSSSTSPSTGRPRDDRPPASARCSSRAILRAALLGVAAQARPARSWPATRSCSSSRSAPSFTTALWIVGEPGQPGWFAFTVAFWLWLTVIFGNFAEAIAEGRGKAQADALRAMRRETTAKLRDGTTKAGLRARPRRRRGRRGGRAHPRRRHRRRGHRLGRRVGDHRRVGARDPRVRRRPQRGHGRHARALGPHRRRDHAGARPVLPGPHDRPGRGRRAAQDAERDRPVDPARRPDDRLPGRRRRAAPVRRVRRDGDLDHEPHRAARRAHPDDDRRPAERDRHRRHGPPRPPQRARPLRPRRRGVRRRRRPAARQDRHDHARQPPGRRVRPDAGRQRGRPRGGGADELAGRRDAGGPLDRRAGEAVRHPRARPSRAMRRASCPSPRRRG